MSCEFEACCNGKGRGNESTLFYKFECFSKVVSCNKVCAMGGSV